LNVSSIVQSRAPSPTLRTTKYGSGSGKGYEKRLPCTSEHIKPTWRGMARFGNTAVPENLIKHGGLLKESTTGISRPPTQDRRC
jgi:hypothetical protein